MPLKEITGGGDRDDDAVTPPAEPGGVLVPFNEYVQGFVDALRSQLDGY